MSVSPQNRKTPSKPTSFFFLKPTLDQTSEKHMSRHSTLLEEETKNLQEHSAGHCASIKACTKADCVMRAGPAQPISHPSAYQSGQTEAQLTHWNDNLEKPTSLLNNLNSHCASNLRCFASHLHPRSSQREEVQQSTETPANDDLRTEASYTVLSSHAGTATYSAADHTDGGDQPNLEFGAQLGSSFG